MQDDVISTCAAKPKGRGWLYHTYARVVVVDSQPFTRARSPRSHRYPPLPFAASRSRVTGCVRKEKRKTTYSYSIDSPMASSLFLYLPERSVQTSAENSHDIKRPCIAPNQCCEACTGRCLMRNVLHCIVLSPVTIMVRLILPPEIVRSGPAVRTYCSTSYHSLMDPAGITIISKRILYQHIAIGVTGISSAQHVVSYHIGQSDTIFVQLPYSSALIRRLAV